MAALEVQSKPGARRLEAAVGKLRAGIEALSAWVSEADGEALGEGLIQIREAGIDPREAVFANGLRRFDRAGEYRADGALSAVAWMRERCNLSGGAAAERVNIARQLEKLPPTQKAFASGSVGFQHVALIARTAENVGTLSVQKGEGNLLQAGHRMDPGRFAGVAKDFEHRVDREAADANRAYARRYLHISEPQDGIVRLDGLLDVEGGATLRTALVALVPPLKNDDDRTPGQRRADALVDLARRPLDGSKLGTVGGQRPHLVITASVETLAGRPSAPAAQMEGVGPIPQETAQHLACDPTLSWLIAHAELENETSHAQRRIPAATRRALVARDRDCVFNGCHRPAIWSDGHHLTWWSRGGKPELPNLALVCGRHHRMVHEGGWTLERTKDGPWLAKPPCQRVPANARSA
jgi:Domain of unknown function (DUF222)